MQRLSRTKRDTIWTKTPSKPRREHTKVWPKRLSKLYQNPNQHMIEKNQINTWLIPKHINTWSVISKGIKSTQQMIEKTPIENKIPIKTKITTRRKDTKKRTILDRNQVKWNKAKRYQDSHNKYQLEQISMEEILNSN